LRASFQWTKSPQLSANKPPVLRQRGSEQKMKTLRKNVAKLIEMHAIYFYVCLPRELGQPFGSMPNGSAVRVRREMGK